MTNWQHNRKLKIQINSTEKSSGIVIFEIEQHNSSAFFDKLSEIFNNKTPKVLHEIDDIESKQPYQMTISYTGSAIEVREIVSNFHDLSKLALSTQA